MGAARSVVLEQPGVDGLTDVVRVMREWQRDGATVPLHPGDLGWNWRFGAEATAAAVRTWSRDGEVLAVGMLDEPRLIRLAAAPDAVGDEGPARQIVADLRDPERGVLPSGSVAVEARFGGVLPELLLGAGWEADEPWAPLCRDLNQPIEESGLRIEVTGPETAQVRAAVQRAAFERSTFTGERWHAMAAGVAYADARCLVGYDDHGVPVAAATVWSAGPGRPGLLEPVGVHREHRRLGYGTAIALAAAGALHDLGSSSATVCTRSANVGAVATYESAGFRRLPDVPDLRRPA